MSSLLTFALSDTIYYADLVKEQDVPQILDTISVKYLSVTNSWALAKAILSRRGPSFERANIWFT